MSNAKDTAFILKFQDMFFTEEGGLLELVNTKELEKLLGKLCNFSRTWPFRKTLNLALANPLPPQKTKICRVKTLCLPLKSTFMVRALFC